jgi:hypothetical protein
MERSTEAAIYVVIGCGNKWHVYSQHQRAHSLSEVGALVEAVVHVVVGCRSPSARVRRVLKVAHSYARWWHLEDAVVYV